MEAMDYNHDINKYDDYFDWIPIEIIEEIILYLDSDDLRNFFQEFRYLIYTINWKKLNNRDILDLSNLQLINIPKGIGLLTNLTQLILIDNLLIDLPKELIMLNNLIELDLNINEFEEIPKVIFELRNLTVLNLSNNKIREIPDEINKLIAIKDCHLATFGRLSAPLVLPISP